MEVQLHQGFNKAYIPQTPIRVAISPSFKGASGANSPDDSRLKPLKADTLLFMGKGNGNSQEEEEYERNVELFKEELAKRLGYIGIQGPEYAHSMELIAREVVDLTKGIRWRIDRDTLEIKKSGTEEFTHDKLLENIAKKQFDILFSKASNVTTYAKDDVFAQLVDIATCRLQTMLPPPAKEQPVLFHPPKVSKTEKEVKDMLETISVKGRREELKTKFLEAFKQHLKDNPDLVDVVDKGIWENTLNKLADIANSLVVDNPHDEEIQIHFQQFSNGDEKIKAASTHYFFDEALKLM